MVGFFASILFILLLYIQITTAIDNIASKMIRTVERFFFNIDISLKEFFRLG